MVVVPQLGCGANGAANVVWTPSHRKPEQTWERLAVDYFAKCQARRAEVESCHRVALAAAVDVVSATVEGKKDA